MSGVNGTPHPRGEEWGKPIGGGSTGGGGGARGGCLTLLIFLAAAFVGGVAAGILRTLVGLAP